MSAISDPRRGLPARTAPSARRASSDLARSPASAVVACVLALAACGPSDARPAGDVVDVSPESLPAGIDPGATRLLFAPPLLGRPTRDGAVLAVLAGPHPLDLELRVAGRDAPASTATLAAGEVAHLAFDGLPPGATSEWALVVRARDVEEREVLRGRVTTTRDADATFTFAVLSDSHLPAPPAHWLEPGAVREPGPARSFDEGHAYTSSVLDRVVASIRAARPDFVVHLGDMLDGHMLGDNAPFPTVDVGRAGYLDLRRHLGGLGAEAAFFAVLGNWDGENGWFPEELTANARHARIELIPNPDATTYPEGGAPNGDWYAFRWGAALFVMLDVQGDTPTAHGLGDDEGRADDWTLGAEQLAWFERTLAASDAPCTIVCAHHTVGGRGGDDDESRYGRGGGRAAHVGEQARIHELLRAHGPALFLYGHDHVFTSMLVDGVAYVLPGSAGAPWKFGAELTGYERFDERSGFGLVTVSSDAVEVRFCDVDGAVFETLRLPGGG
ncbi:MAG: metallophosphoesterase [Planctomycetes bacterium]|nr:metallophosphoesterase [Planctomycetota bacterium]